MNGGIQIRISDLIFALKKRWGVILAMTLLGLFFGFALSGMNYVQSALTTYEVTGSFAVTTLNSSGQYINGASVSNNNDYHLAEDMVDAVRYVMTSKQVVDAVINDQKLLGITIDDIRDNLSLSQYNSTQILEMRLIWRSPEEGVDIWNAIITASNRVLPRSLQLGSLAVIDVPEAELYGASNLGPKTAALLAALGFAAGCAFALMELLMHPTLNNLRDVETLLGLETLGTVPPNNKMNRYKGDILDQDEASPVVQSFASTAHILRNRLGSREKHHCFFVTSATANEGKSAAAANLAIQLSNMDYRTLLIDYDTRNPTIATMFLKEVDYTRTLNALYRGETVERMAITRINAYLDLLPTVLEYKSIPMDSVVEDLFLSFAKEYDYVIINAPPVGLASETLSLNQVTNTALFVVGYDKATIPEIQNAIEKMDKSGIRMLGCVVNGASIRGGVEMIDRRGPRGPKQTVHVQETFMKAKKKTDVLEEMTKPVSEPQEETEKSKKQDAPRPAMTPDAVKMSSGAKRARNVMDDLMQTSETESRRSDMDTMSALMKMGLEGEWGDESAKEANKSDKDSDNKQ